MSNDDLDRKLDPYKKFEKSEAALHDRLFWANAGGSVAMLSFVGAALAAGKDVVGEFPLAMFVAGICTNVVSLFFESYDKLLFSMRMSDLEDQLKKHYFLNPYKPFVRKPFEHSKWIPEWHSNFVQRLLGKDRVETEKERLVKIVKNSDLYAFVCATLSLGFFITGCLSGFIILITV